MKIRRNWMYTGIAVLCVALGLKLPDLVFLYLDKGGAGEARTFTTDAVSVGVELDITDYLRLAGSQYEVFNVEKNAAVSHSDEIFDSAMEALSLLSEYERKAGVPELCTMILDDLIIPYNDKSSNSQTDFGHSETPVMAAVQLEDYSEKTSVRSDPGAMQTGRQTKTVTAVVWKCQIWNGVGNCIEMLIDDASKKLLSFKVVWSHEWTFMMNTENIDMDSMLRSLTYAYANFFQEYYGLEPAELDIDMQDGDHAETTDAGEGYDSQTYAYWDMPADSYMVSDESKSGIEDATTGNIGDIAVGESMALGTSAATEGERTIETDMALGDGSKTAVRIVEDGSYAYLQYTDGTGNILKLPISLDDDHYSFNTVIATTSRVNYRNIK